MNKLPERISSLSPARRALLEKMIEEARVNRKGLQLSPMLPVARDEDIPLSFTQERLWFLDQLDPGSPAYVMPFALRLTGHLNVTALEQSLGEIFRRHEVLRTIFVNENDKPRQIIVAADFKLLQINLAAIPEEQRQAEAHRLANEEASRPFDIADGPLLRTTLIHMDPKDCILLLTMHHIVSDGWSMGIFYRELSVLYESYSIGNPSPLPELPIQYADFAVWQRQWLLGESLEKQLTFWKEHLKDISCLNLPADHPRPPVQTFNGARHTLKLAKGLTGVLLGLSRKEGVTLFMTLLAAFQSLLHRYTGQDDIIVGTPIANRNRAEIEGLIGFFVNTLVMRTDTSGDPVFRGLLQRVRKTTLDAYAHQDLPFDKLVAELQPARDLSRNPIFQVTFALQNRPFSDMQLKGLTLSRVEIERTITRFDLEVHLWETAEGLKCTFVYNTDLFEAATITRMSGHYQEILEGIAANPDLRLSELPLLTDAERQLLVMEWNNTGTDYPKDSCVHELFEIWVDRTPDAIAAVFQRQRLTYRELNSKANQLAYYLRKLGIGPDVLVGICVERSIEMIIGILGILKAGGAYVPLDSTYPKDRLAFMIGDTRAPVILTQQHLADVFEGHSAKVVCLDSDAEKIAQESRETPVNTAKADNLIYVMYTSGSTGKPKGVCVPHRAVARLVLATNYIKIGPSDTVAQASSFSFDAATFEIWGALLNGARLFGVTRDVALSPEDFAGQLSAHGISVLFLTTALFNQMARRVPEAFRSVRCLLFGGEVADPACVRMVIKGGSRHQLLHMYGPTESTTFTSWYPVQDVCEDVRTVPIGKPVSNTTIYILDLALQPVPVGIPGELYIGGDGLARGYLDRSELTAEKFVPDPFSEAQDGARLYRSGDLARYLEDGSIEFLGRIDHQVKVRGFRIEPGEIETVLKQHPSVLETVVVAREDQPGDKRVVAYVVPNKPAVTGHELKDFMKKKLPDYMVPSALIILDRLPLTASGKVDRCALPAPDSVHSDAGNGYVAPRNTLESGLTSIWEKLLGVQPVGVRDNFFELGGHSLLAVRLVSEIKKELGKILPLHAVLRSPTIEQMAEVLKGEGPIPEPPSMMVQSGGSRLPLFWVGINTYLPHYLGCDQPVYGIVLQGEYGKPMVYDSVEELAAHHLDEIRTVQPRGPYLLGGYCFWGLVAFEMAQQLFRQGEEVSLLCLVEPPPQCMPFTGPGNASSSSSVPLISKVKFLRTNPEFPRGADKRVSVSRLLRRSTLMDKIKVAICQTSLFLGYSVPLRLRDFYYMHTARNYVPRAYPGRAVVFFRDKTCGVHQDWNRLAAGRVNVHEVPGAGHFNIKDEPFVGIWAKQLNSYLDETRAGREH